MPQEITPGSLRYRQLEKLGGLGDAEAALELGLIWSSGTGGFAVDLIQAHKWFNLAALAGSDAGAQWRHEVAEEMTAREIVEAQREARNVLHAMQPVYAQAA